jgi:hypothetical protein
LADRIFRSEISDFNINISGRSNINKIKMMLQIETEMNEIYSGATAALLSANDGGARTTK